MPNVRSAVRVGRPCIQIAAAAPNLGVNEPPVFEVTVIALSGSATSEHAAQIEFLFRRILEELPWPVFGDLTVHFLAGKPRKLVRTDTELIE